MSSWCYSIDTNPANLIYILSSAKEGGKVFAGAAREGEKSFALTPTPVHKGETLARELFKASEIPAKIIFSFVCQRNYSRTCISSQKNVAEVDRREKGARRARRKTKQKICIN
jgi:hypothetical protein